MKNKTIPTTLLQKLRYITLSSRPVSWLNTAYPFAAGYIIVSHHFSWLLVLGTVYFLIPYNLMMYGVNDVFDYESDILNPRKGGLEGAKLAKSQHRNILIAVAITNLPFLAVLFTVGSAAAKLTLALVIFMVLAYSVPKLRFKERPFLDSITSSCHFVGPLVYALVLLGWHRAYLPYVVAFFLWGMASHAFGAVQDIPSDRAGKLASIGTVLGARSTTWFSLVLYVASVLVLATRGLAGLVIAMAGLLYIANIAPYWKITDKTAETANVAWRRFIWLNLVTGFVVTMVLIQVYLRHVPACQLLLTA
ncbi:MAG: prenyltransferase [Patescibacteria group bacterium]|nr:prenyltransferase [Patescibacteria group bacterium]